MDIQATLKLINKVSQNTLMQTLSIEFIDISQDKVVAKMPVTSKVHQPDGILHGGASVALAETVGSYASFLSIDSEKKMVRGLEISANHLRGIKDGWVTATARPLHKGRTTHLWEIRVEDEEQQLISLCKLSTIILDKKSSK